MAQIVAKAFDATKKVMRSIFLGSPNLFTTSDINRQIEATKYQLDHIEKTLGYLSDMTIVASYDVANYVLRTITAGTFLDALGCHFTDEGLFNTFTLDNVLLGDNVYLIGELALQTLDYSDDPQHEVVGALFEDGSSMPSANQVVVTSSLYFLSKSVPADTATNRYIVLAKIQAMQNLGKVDVLVTPYFVRTATETAIGLSSELWAEKQQRRKYDTSDYLGVNWRYGKITDGILHLQFYGQDGKPATVTGTFRNNYPATPSSSNLLERGWLAEWFENFKFTYVNETSQFYVKFIPLTEAVQGTAQVGEGNLPCSILSCRGATIGIVLYFSGGRTAEHCTGIFIAPFIPLSAVIIARRDSDGEIFTAGQLSGDPYFLSDITLTFVGNHYIDLAAGSRGLD